MTRTDSSVFYMTLDTGKEIVSERIDIQDISVKWVEKIAGINSKKPIQGLEVAGAKDSIRETPIEETSVEDQVEDSDSTLSFWATVGKIFCVATEAGHSEIHKDAVHSACEAWRDWRGLKTSSHGSLYPNSIKELELWLENGPLEWFHQRSVK